MIHAGQMMFHGMLLDLQYFQRMSCTVFRKLASAEAWESQWMNRDKVLEITNKHKIQCKFEPRPIETEQDLKTHLLRIVEIGLK